MKKAGFVLVILFSLSAFSLEKGRYECTNGNEASICPQIVIPQLEEQKLSALKIYYSGYCNDQGPFYYDCDNGICGDGAIEFSELKEDSYRWQNLPYGFVCDFKKTK